jgi:hypothetical protein
MFTGFLSCILWSFFYSEWLVSIGCSYSHLKCRSNQLFSIIWNYDSYLQKESPTQAQAHVLASLLQQRASHSQGFHNPTVHRFCASGALQANAIQNVWHNQCIVGRPSSNHVFYDIRAQGHCLISQSIKGLYCSNIIKNTRKALNSTTRDFTETCVGQLAFSTIQLS